MPLPDSFLQELTDRSPIEPLAQAYVSGLKRRGRNLVGLCPFHNEKTPSFTVYPENNSFYCFGCGAGGDVISFVKRVENLDYIDAVKFLAGRAGMKMPEEGVNDAVSRLRARVLEANREAARFFHATLYSPIGKQALEYYHRRGYTDATIRHFGLGYAPDDYHALTRALRQKGFRDEELVSAFLCARSRQQNGGIFDIFRNRVMIPIIDVRGSVIAFGGRVMDDSKPKYINTSDTPAFKKTHNLFALNFAKNQKAQSLILCEGYMDVIALHQAGFENAVAALGTSFTADHARLVARYAREAILIFDADAAGQKGTKRAIDLLRETGVEIRVVTIPDGKDPDEFIKKNGADRFRVLLDRSANDVEYRLIRLGQDFDLSTDDGRVRYLMEASKLLTGLSDPIEREVYAGRLSEQLNVRRDAILEQIARLSRQKHRQEEKHQLSHLMRESENQRKHANPDAAAHPRAADAEEALLGAMMLHPDCIRRLADTLSPDDFATQFNRGLYQLIVSRDRAGQRVEPTYLAEGYSDDEVAYIVRMRQKAQERANPPEEIAHYAEVIRQEHRLAATADPASMSLEQMQQALSEFRKTKK